MLRNMSILCILIVINQHVPSALLSLLVVIMVSGRQYYYEINSMASVTSMLSARWRLHYFSFVIKVAAQARQYKLTASEVCY